MRFFRFNNYVVILKACRQYSYPCLWKMSALAAISSRNLIIEFSLVKVVGSKLCASTLSTFFSASSGWSLFAFSEYSVTERRNPATLKHMTLVEYSKQNQSNILLAKVSSRSDTKGELHWQNALNITMHWSIPPAVGNLLSKAL